MSRHDDDGRGRRVCDGRPRTRRGAGSGIVGMRGIVGRRMGRRVFFARDWWD